MKAVRIHEYGDAGVMRYEDAPAPEIKSDEILLRVVAAAVNPVDWKVRRGYRKERFSHPMPLTLGWDASGIVEAVGEDVSRFKPGDAVFTRPDILRNGTYAEYVAVREEEAALKPKTVSHVDAASLPLVGLTAWQSLFTASKLSAGQRVLIHGGSGGVGTIAVQLAKAHGAYVISTTSGKNLALVELLGADEVIDYTKQRFEKVVRDADVVFDTIGGDVQERSWSVVKPGGVLVSIVSPPPEEKAKAHRVRGAYVFIQPDAEMLARLSELVDAGKVRPVVCAELALKDAAKAHALSESGHAVGKIVLYVGTP